MTLTPWRLRLLVVSLLTVSFIGALDHTIVSTSLATIAGDLGALTHMSWIVVGYTLASTVLLPIIGKLGDMLGPRAVFLTSLIVFLLASLACGFAHDMAQLIVSRVLQGMSSAGIQLMSQTIIARVTSPRERPRYMSIIGAAFPIAILVGPLIGGLITDNWSWPWVFWINIPVGIAALALALFAVPHIPGGARARFDVAGSLTFTIAMVSLVLAVTWVGDPSGTAAAVVAFILAFGGFATFFIIELRTAEPMLPMTLFANRTIAVGIGLSTIIGIGMFSITAYLPTYVQMAYRTSATVSGLVPIATVFGMLASNLLTGWLASRTGHYRSFPIVGTTLGAAGLFAMAMLPIGVPLWAPMSVMAVVGFGTGSFMTLIVAVVQGAAPRGEIGSVTAAVNLVRQIGSTISTAIIGGFVGFSIAALLPVGLDAATLTPELVHGASAAVQGEVAQIYHDVFSSVFVALAITYVVGIVIAILLPRGRLSDQMEPAVGADPQTITA